MGRTLVYSLGAFCLFCQKHKKKRSLVKQNASAATVTVSSDGNQSDTNGQTKRIHPQYPGRIIEQGRGNGNVQSARYQQRRQFNRQGDFSFVWPRYEST